MADGESVVDKPCRPFAFLIGLPFALIAIVISIVGAVIYVIGSVLNCICPCFCCCVELVYFAVDLIKLPFLIVIWFTDLIPC